MREILAGASGESPVTVMVTRSPWRNGNDEGQGLARFGDLPISSAPRMGRFRAIWKISYIGQIRIRTRTNRPKSSEIVRNRRQEM